MKAKTIAVLAALSLVATAFAACGKEPAPEEKTTTTTTATTEAPTEESTETTTTTTTEITKIEVDSVETVLTHVKNFRPGTAGSSIKIVSTAMDLINLTESLDETKGALKDAEYFLDALSSEELENFKESLSEVDYIAREIINGPTDKMKDRIEESGGKYNENGYSLEKYEAIYNFIADWENE